MPYPTQASADVPLPPAPPVHRSEHQRDIVNRLRRIEGQVRALAEMIDAGRPCEDIAQQMSAARKAMDKAFYRHDGLLDAGSRDPGRLDPGRRALDPHPGKVRLKPAGAQTYLVGGAVRDGLLGHFHTAHQPARRQPACRPRLGRRRRHARGDDWRSGFLPVGRDFPVFLHPRTREEYALARTERKTARGYHGFAFHADADVSLEEDLARRDLTINAIACPPRRSTRRPLRPPHRA